MKNKIDDLRNHLFATIEELRDPDKPMDIARARAVADVAKVVIETAKTEVAYLKVTGGRSGSGFIPDDARALPSTVTEAASTNGAGLAPLRTPRRQ